MSVLLRKDPERVALLIYVKTRSWKHTERWQPTTSREESSPGIELVRPLILDFLAFKTGEDKFLLFSHLANRILLVSPSSYSSCFSEWVIIICVSFCTVSERDFHDKPCQLKEFQEYSGKWLLLLLKILVILSPEIKLLSK